MEGERTGKPAGNPVRRRRERDLGECVRALGEVHRQDGYPVDWPAQPALWLGQASALGAWVAELTGRPVGHVGLDEAGGGDTAPGLWSAGPGRGRGAAVVSRLFVAPEARGRGLGAMLLQSAVGEARRRGLHPVLDVVATDRAACALYERHGWVLLGKAEQHWGPGRTVPVRCYAAPPGGTP